MSIGLRFISSTFGVEPLVGWQIDSFGHSCSTEASDVVTPSMESYPKTSVVFSGLLQIRGIPCAGCQSTKLLSHVVLALCFGYCNLNLNSTCTY